MPHQLLRVMGVVVAALVAVAVTACDPKMDLTPQGSWTQTGHASVNSLTGAEGIASRESGSLVRRGPASIPSAIKKEGFKHIGDLDIAKGDIFDSYQNTDHTGAKMFLVTTADGKRHEYRHTLDSGELFNNSFVAVSPDDQWIVSGEFGTQHRLQVFPAPLLNASTPRDGGALPQAPEITLDRPIDNIQGCDFFSAERLLCTADDTAKEVFRIDLSAPLDGKAATGKVTPLFRLPRISKCSGAYEAEGIDYDPSAKTLRAAIISPGLCKATTVVFSYLWKAA